MERSTLCHLTSVITTLGLSPSDDPTTTRPSLTPSSRTQLSLDLQAGTLTRNDSHSLEGWLYTDQASLLDQVMATVGVGLNTGEVAWRERVVGSRWEGVKVYQRGEVRVEGVSTTGEVVVVDWWSAREVACETQVRGTAKVVEGLKGVRWYPVCIDPEAEDA
jgi:hypothetical protein